jgi:hypothetical protein
MGAMMKMAQQMQGGAGAGAAAPQGGAPQGGMPQGGGGDMNAMM